MKNIIDYILVSEWCAADLSEKVKHLIENERMVPFGSPFMNKNGCLYQAMVRYETIENFIEGETI